MGCTTAARGWITAHRYTGVDSAGGMVAASDITRFLVIPGTHPFRKSAEWMGHAR
jgi:hypothetical protein